MNISKNDWMLFRNRLPVWQERHMENLISDYIKLLSGSENPSERFWSLEKKIKQDKRSFGVRAEVTKQNMLPIIATLLRDHVIDASDIYEFSEDVKERVACFQGNNRHHVDEKNL